MDNDYLNLLSSIGLQQKEAKVYLALLELEQGTVSKIAKLSGLKRPTIYLILDDLIKNGYVTELPDQKINQYQAISPEIIASLKKTALRNFSEMLPLLLTIGGRGNRPKISYLETEKAILNAYEEMNYAKESFYINSHSKIEKLFPGSITDWLEKNNKGFYKHTGKNIVPDNEADKKIASQIKNAAENVRYLPQIKEFDIDLIIYEDKLAINSLEEKPFMVIIQSQKLASSMKSIFNLIWKLGKKIETKN